MEQQVNEHKNLIYFVLKNYNLTIDEFYDLGLIGLIKGIKSYDESKGYSKSTYLVACIKNELNMYFRKKRPQTVSLNKVYNEEGQDELIETVRDTSLTPDQIIENRELTKILYECVELLPDKYKQIVVNHYGLYNKERKTQTESAKELNLNVGQAQMSRNLTIALSKLRRLMEERDVTKADRFNTK